MPHRWSLLLCNAPLSAITKLLLAFSCVLILQDIPPCSAQDLGHPKYQFQRRFEPDRQEGIKGLERSGEYLDLVSVLLDAPGPPVGSPGDAYRVGFFLATPERGVRITVRDYDRFTAEKYHYWMIPSRAAFGQGFQVFAWDAVLARELRIGLDGLGAVASLGGHGNPVVAPLLLQETPFGTRIRARGVRFVFVPNETMTVEYQVHQKGNPSRILLRGAEEKWDKLQRSPVSWTGRDPKGQPVGEGHYVLALTARVRTLRGFEEKIPLDYTFYYKPEIASGP